MLARARPTASTAPETRCAAQMVGRLQDRDHRSGDPDDRDPDAGDGGHQVGIEAGGVGGEPGEAGIAARPLHRGGARGVLVIPDRHGGIAKQVHGAHHRVAERPRTRLVHGLERRTLNRVAAVDQQRVRIFGAYLPHQRRDRGQAASAGRFVA